MKLEESENIERVYSQIRKIMEDQDLPKAFALLVIYQMIGVTLDLPRPEVSESYSGESRYTYTGRVGTGFR